MEQGNKSLAGDSGSPVKSSIAVELVIVSSVQQSQKYCSNHKRDYAWRDKSDFFAIVHSQCSKQLKTNITHRLTSYLLSFRQ